MNVPDEESGSQWSRELTRIEAEAFFYTVYEHLGHDFRHYSDASRNRRLVGFVRRHSLGTISEAQARAIASSTASAAREGSGSVAATARCSAAASLA